MDSNTVSSFQVDCFLWHVRKRFADQDMGDAPFLDRLRRDQKSLKGRSSTLGIDIEAATRSGKKIIERILDEESNEALKMTVASVPASRYVTDMTPEEMSRDWFMLMPKQKFAGPLCIKMDQAIIDKDITLKANFSVIFNRLETLVLLRAFTNEGAIVGEISQLPSLPGHTSEDVKNAIGVLIGGLEWNDNTVRISETLQRFAWGSSNENGRPPFAPEQKQKLARTIESEV
ncbi:nonstructural protein 1 [Influenza A virus (A/black-headed gull/Netherlands/8/2014(H13N2))]|uniref:Non-structural protein 1 n=5 Tax=H13N2 subtype TaxID=286281 RepID=A0A1L6BQI9_9INFA|nr:nonstructural protein 1 [Influenza A virus (A/black-headed gull/Netherlands/8/2014(H13N2))]APC32676.1 nonstructural protein 1 [Influenza A virus (A/black-headed gull/Netherlands/25/2014(H13N2))]APQ31372.1 nonstructural protein 1 [Influenza A virus (A/black-headed gull/Netherlands/23/2014(H13N2))]ARX91563.1 nonstructural protein 1 [Influenza A virus (A/black-headed gull/Netherlands/24/2014(H13N2))]ARX93727.1 nonstructural protein 1 [Influenza A virus (A/black-headed gull/Netherlands/37/2014(H